MCKSSILLYGQKGHEGYKVWLDRPSLCRVIHVSLYPRESDGTGESYGGFDSVLKCIEEHPPRPPLKSRHFHLFSGHKEVAMMSSFRLGFLVCVVFGLIGAKSALATDCECRMRSLGRCITIQPNLLRFVFRWKKTRLKCLIQTGRRETSVPRTSLSPLGKTWPGSLFTQIIVKFTA